MKKPISPAEWDALSQRQQRARGHARPSDEQHTAEMAAYHAYCAEKSENNKKIAPMLKVGGREWNGDRGGHRVYFDLFRIPRYDHSRGPMAGYYDVDEDSFKSTIPYITDAQFTEFIVPVIDRGGDLPEDMSVTFDAAGNAINEGDECVIVVPKDPTSRDMDITANVGRIVVTLFRIRNWDRLDSHWFVTSADSSNPLTAEGKNFISDQSKLALRSSSLMLINPRRKRRDSPLLPPTVCHPDVEKTS